MSQQGGLEALRAELIRISCGRVEMPDLAGGTDQVGVIQLRRDIVFVGLGV